MERASLDDTRKSLDSELIKPLPGRRSRVTQAVVEDEMALFRSAQGSKGR